MQNLRHITDPRLQRTNIFANANYLKSLNPFALYSLNEPSGSTAIAFPDTAMNGTNSNVNAYRVPMGDGVVGYEFDTDIAAGHINIFTAAFDAAFDGQEGSAIISCKLESGVWSDGETRYLLGLFVDNDNSIKLSVNGAGFIVVGYEAGATPKALSYATTTTDKFVLGVTWSLSKNRFRLYFNGVQQGADATGLGPWAGALSATATCIAAINTASTFPMDGLLAICGLYTYELSASQIAGAS